MNIRSLDHLIGSMLSTGPKTAEKIWEERAGECALSDVQAGLRVWIRNGWARELGTGMYELVEEEAA
jgi:hypothetical protein